MPRPNAEFTFMPGAVAANTATAMPANAPIFGLLTEVVVLTEEDAAGATGSLAPPVTAQIVFSVPSGGLTGNEFYFNPTTQQWQFAQATTAGTVFIFKGYTKGAITQVA